jgi:hypothetical protein
MPSSTPALPFLDAADPVRFLGDLLTIALRRAYQPGWIYYCFKERCGRAPTMPELQAAKQAARAEPCLATLTFVAEKHRRARAEQPNYDPIPKPKKAKAKRRKPAPPVRAVEPLPPGLYARARLMPGGLLDICNLEPQGNA